MTDFAARVAAFFDAFFALDPISATGAGMHAHDGRWPDVTERGRIERLAFVDGWTAQLERFADDMLSTDEAVDRDVILGVLQAIRFDADELREESWSAMAWIYLVGEGFFGLVSRDFAPLATRLASLASRAEALPAVLDGARDVLVGHGGRPVARFHAEKALEQWPGLIGLVDEAIATAEGAATAGDADTAAVLPRLRAARETAAAALATFETHLRDTVLPRSEGEGRLGPELFAAKMVHTMKDPAMTPARIRERAEREYAAVRAEMVRIAREIAPDWLAGAPVPADDDAVVRAVLDAVAADHPERGAALDFCREELARIEAFCREQDLIGLAEEPLEIDWTPIFLRSFAGAMLSSPGPLDRGQKAMFFITPIADDATPEQSESALREDNTRMLRLLTIHEAVPGHYLQGVYANRSGSLARSIFWSGVYAEGWAVYVTQVMADAGYGADDPALMLTHWKYYLRCVVNALIDVGLHTAGMTGDEAVRLMVEGAFQEEAQARSKFDRARLSSTQLSTYFVGSLAFWDLEDEVRRRAAVASGDPRGAAAVPTPRVVGDYGATPGFRYREHLEACVSHGAPPMPLLRRLILGDALPVTAGEPAG
ncbi:MAG TPA: DUF885 domain-containing protein [Candidatus Limnocylindrales bacterium]|nr:DUF885 domain-containing protein [Candidatus Limnocylindrales bacterium]